MTETIFVIASVVTIPVKVIKTLQTGYHIPDPLPWTTIAGPLVSLSVTDFNLQRLAENRRTLFRSRFQQDPDSALTHLAFRSWTAQSSQRPS